jgi:hypothetical protein
MLKIGEGRTAIKRPNNIKIQQLAFPTGLTGIKSPFNFFSSI